MPEPEDTSSITPGWIPLTYEHYRMLPNDGKRYQILEGDLDVTPAPTTTHQKISSRLEHIVIDHVEARELGLVLAAPVDVLLSPKNVVQPDIVFVSRARLSIVEEAYIAGPPDLVVEILSPSTSRTDRDTKSQIYARYGVAWYWIVDPRVKTVEEYELKGKGFDFHGRFDERFAPRLFPGLSIDLAKIFRP